MMYSDIPRAATRRVASIAFQRGGAVLIAAIAPLCGCAASAPSNASQYPADSSAQVRQESVLVRGGDAVTFLADIDRSLSEWVDFALKTSPRVASARAQYAAAVEGAAQVTALPDPRLSYRYFIEEVETRVGPQEFALGISQPLPWLGKLRLQGDVASERANAAAARVSTVQNAVIADVATAWYELYYFSRAIEIMRGNRDLVRHLERVARTRYRSGASGHPDVVRAQLELGRIENELASMADREAPLLARLNASLNRPPGAPVRMPDQAPVIDVAKGDAALVQQVVENNPELRALSFDVAAAAAARQRAEKEFYPDFAIGVDYIATDKARMPGIPGSGKDPLAAAFTMTLPIHRGKYRAGVRAAEARIAGERARRDERLNALQAETVSAVFRLRDARRQIDLYRTTLLPKARESLAATQRAYSAGSSTFVDLVDVQRTLLVFELAEARAIADHNQARTNLEKLIGRPLGQDQTQGEQNGEQ